MELKPANKEDFITEHHWFHQSLKANEVREQRMLKLQTDALNAPWSENQRHHWDFNNKGFKQKKFWFTTFGVNHKNGTSVNCNFVKTRISHTQQKHGKIWNAPSTPRCCLIFHPSKFPSVPATKNGNPTTFFGYPLVSNHGLPENPSLVRWFPIQPQVIEDLPIFSHDFPHRISIGFP